MNRKSNNAKSPRTPRTRSKTRKVTLRTKEAQASVRIRKLVKANPRREGTAGYNSFSILKDGMTYAQYIEKGGRNTDLQWDLAHGYVQLEAAA